jgi:Protein of Unknown function (DUF2784)
MVVHFAFLGYVIVGGFLAWRWPWAIWPHLAAVGWGLSTVLVTLPCPLTGLEDWSRRRAGQAGLPRGFFRQYLEGVVYPARYTAVLEWVIATVVMATWFGACLLWRAR